MSHRVIGVWLAVVACGGGESAVPDDVVTSGRAVTAWREGHRALVEGQAAVALAQFEAARRWRPDDGLLLAWSAEAARQAGDDAEADRLLDAAIAAAPTLGEARWARARRRVGTDPEGAVTDLSAAIRAGALTRYEARRDTTFHPLVGRADAPWLPAEPVGLSLEVPSAPVFVGGEFEVVLTVDGVPHDDGVAWTTRVPVEGPVSQVRASSSRREDGLGEPGYRVTWTLRADGSGRVGVGPVSVQIDGTTTALAGAVVTQLGPARAGQGAAVPLVLGRPEAVLGDRPVPAVWHDGTQAWAAWPAEASLRRPRVTRPWLVPRDHGMVAFAPVPVGETRVVVDQDGQVLLDVAVPEGPPAR